MLDGSMRGYVCVDVLCHLFDDLTFETATPRCYLGVPASGTTSRFSCWSSSASVETITGVICYDGLDIYFIKPIWWIL